MRPGRRRALASLVAVAVIGAATATAGDPTATPEADARIALLRSWLHRPKASILAVTPNLGLVWLNRGAPGKTAGLIEGVEVQGEVIDPLLAQQRGWRSMRLTLDIACSDHKARVRAFQVFTDHDAGGARADRPVPGGWMRPSDGADLNAVIDALCGPSATREATAAKLTRADPAMDAGPASPNLASTPSSKAAPTPPSPKPAPIPAVAAQGAQVAASATAQVNASPDRADAQAALDRAIGHGDPALARLTPHVEPAQVHGRQMFRALVSGFATRAEAKAFCDRVQAAGGACFVRPNG